MEVKAGDKVYRAEIGSDGEVKVRKYAVLEGKERKGFCRCRNTRTRIARRIPFEDIHESPLKAIEVLAKKKLEEVLEAWTKYHQAKVVWEKVNEAFFDTLNAELSADSE